MSTLYEQLNKRIESGEPVAIATLVSTSGSSPQNAGAKVLFMPDGRIVGTIGGGCMEVEARRFGLDCLRKSTSKLFDLQLDDDFGWDDGLICGGTVRIFICAYPERSAEAYAAAQLSAQKRERAALCTIVSGPDEIVGRAVLMKPDSGEWIGKMDGLPADSLESAVGSAITKGGVTLSQLGESEILVYVEPILPRPTLLIAGAGHIGAAVAQIASLCEFDVVVVDDRPSFANPERLPFATQVVAAPVAEFVRDFPIGEDTYIVIVTRGHRNDAQALRDCIHSKAKYIGMIGSKRKICVIYEELLRDGLATHEELRKVHSPMGLTLNDKEVGEIAVSIVAELVAIRRGADLDQIRPMQYLPPFLRTDNH